MEPEFVQVVDRCAVVRFQSGVYGVDPILKAAHALTDRCFVHIEQAPDGGFVVRLRAAESLANVHTLAGELANNVLDECVRARVAEATEPVRRLLIAQAFSRASLIQPELDLAGGGEGDDPMGIGKPDER